MIYDNIKNLHLYTGINSRIKKVLDFFDTNNISELTEGRYEIDGEDIFLLVQEFSTASKVGRTYEAHEEYIDIQYVIEGEELMKYAARIGGETVLKEYPKGSDIAMYKPKTIEQNVVVSAGYFTIFTPLDLHMPCLQVKEGTSEQIKKFVIKLKV